jgi:hypothetical protein
MTQEALKLALEALEGVLDDAPKVLDASISGGLYEVVQCRDAITAIKEALAQPDQNPVAWKLMPRDATDAMLKAMDECSTEGYDERLYAGHAASVYMAAWDALDTTPPPCPTCEALARTVMLDQTSHDNFKPDWDAMAVMVEEQQRMAKRILELEALLERQTARIVGLQEHIENFDGEDR